MSDPVAIVTGGLSGIGAALTAKLVEESYRVVVFDRNAPQEDRPGAGKVQFRQVNVRDEAAVISTVRSVHEELGHIDALANCAGIARASLITETALESWNEVISTNLTGTFLVCREVAKIMQLGTGGAMVNIASIDAHAADPRFGSYNASKAGLLGLTRTLAIELAHHAIRVNSVSPGLVLTPMILAGTASSSNVLDHLKQNFNRVPMRRLLEPAEIASLCAFLLSSQASAITGADFVADGGLLADSYLVNSYPEQA